MMELEKTLFLSTLFLYPSLLRALSLPQSELCSEVHAPGSQPWRFHKETKRCYAVGSRGPCGHLMAFTLVDNKYGICDCDLALRCGRPLLYWPHTKSCYYAYDKGPCGEGKWLVFGFNGDPICRKNSCQKEEDESPSSIIRYWFNKGGKCYKTYSQGFCSSETQILFNKEIDRRPKCYDYAECAPMPKVQRLSCLPGQLLDYFHECDKRTRTQLRQNVKFSLWKIF